MNMAMIKTTTAARTSRTTRVINQATATNMSRTRMTTKERRRTRTRRTTKRTWSAKKKKKKMLSAPTILPKNVQERKGETQMKRQREKV